MCCCCLTRKARRKQLELLTEIRDILRRLNQAARLIFSATIPGQPTKKGITMLTLTDVQKATLSIQPVDAKGNPARVDGAPEWTSSGPVTLVAAPDGLSAVVTAGDTLGVGQVTVKADADLGAGTIEIIGTLDLEVVASQAVSLQVNAGTPENA